MPQWNCTIAERDGLLVEISVRTPDSRLTTQGLWGSVVHRLEQTRVAIDTWVGDAFLGAAAPSAPDPASVFAPRLSEPGGEPAPRGQS